MKGISEAITVVFLILITLIAITVVSLYYLHTISLNQLSLTQEIKDQYIDAGQLLSLVYYQQKGNSSYFYVVNIGNIPINISQIYVNSIPVKFIVYNSTTTHIKVLYPQLVYVILVYTNTTSIVIKTTNNNLIQIGA